MVHLLVLVVETATCLDGIELRAGLELLQGHQGSLGSTMNAKTCVKQVIHRDNPDTVEALLAVLLTTLADSQFPVLVDFFHHKVTDRAGIGCPVLARTHNSRLFDHLGIVMAENVGDADERVIRAENVEKSVFYARLSQFFNDADGHFGVVADHDIDLRPDSKCDRLPDIRDCTSYLDFRLLDVSTLLDLSPGRSVDCMNREVEASNSSLPQLREELRLELPVRGDTTRVPGTGNDTNDIDDARMQCGFSTCQVELAEAVLASELGCRDNLVETDLAGCIAAFLVAKTTIQVAIRCNTNSE